MRNISKAAFSLALAFQLPLHSFATTSLSPEQLQKSVELSRIQTQLDLQQISDSLLKYQQALATIKTEINLNADGSKMRKFKIGTAVTSTVLIAGGVLMLLRPQIDSQRTGFNVAWYGAMVSLANSLVTTYGTGKLKDWNSSEVLEAKGKNAQLQNVLKEALSNQGLDEGSRQQLSSLQNLSVHLSQILDREDHTLMDKADKAMAALQIVAFAWGVIDLGNMGAVRLGQNYVGWTTIERAIVISFGALKALTGLHLLVNPENLRAVNDSLDETLANLDQARMKLNIEIEKSSRP